MKNCNSGQDQLVPFFSTLPHILYCDSYVGVMR